MNIQTSYHHRFRDIGNLDIGLYYGDINIISLNSSFLQDEVYLSYRLSKKCGFETIHPVIPATMDTISESAMCIHASLNGSFAAVHKGLGPEKQGKEVNKTKRYKAGYIPNPVTLHPDVKISEAVAIRRKFGYKTVPIINKENVLLGALEAVNYSQKYHLEDTVEQHMTGLDDLLIESQDIDPEKAYDNMVTQRVTNLFYIDKTGKFKGMSTRTDIETSEYPNPTKDKHGRLVCGASVGGPGRDLEQRLKMLIENEADIIVIDTAQGDSEGVRYTIKEIQNFCPDMPIIAGNVDNKYSVRRLIDWGADIIKVGIGPGSICKTTQEIGAGIPPLNSVWECAEAAKESGISIIADGGFDGRGDVAKGIAAGAKAAMSGHFFRATDETPGEIKFGKDASGNEMRYKEYSGMASPEALARSGGGRYYQDGVPVEKIAVQGETHMVPCRGPVDFEFSKLLTALKFGMAVHYGSKTIDELSTNPDLSFIIKK